MKIERKKGVKNFRIVEHNKTLLYWIIALFILLLIIVCIILSLDKKESQKDNSQIANPASVYCINNSGTLKLINDENGSYGICTLPNGLECEEWAYFRGECGNSVNNSDFCSVNSDCVPSSCCHPKSCVNKNSAPNCSGIACTMMCELGTLDCGQASCGCVNGKCQVQIN